MGHTGHEAKRQWNTGLSSWCIVCLTLFVFLAPRAARADIELGKSDGWTVSTDGRINGFLSYTTGEGTPTSPNDPMQVVNIAGTSLEDFTDNKNNIETLRIRTGFVGSILGFKLTKPFSEMLTLTGRFQLWSVIESNRQASERNYPDMREVYLRADGLWGGALIGRSVGLFNRGAIEIDFLYGHNYGLGHPCDTKSKGPTCGHVGYGVFFPSFNAGIVYNTPSLAGLKLTAGMYDPSTLALPGYVRTPLPRIESELGYDFGEKGPGGESPPFALHLFVNGLWQRLVQAGDPSAPVTTRSEDAWGLGMGGRVEVMGAFKIGASFHTGKGIGLAVPLENSPTAANTDGDLRDTNGMYVQAMYSFPTGTDLAAGYGISRVKELPTDTTISLIEHQRGISAAVYQHINQNFVLGFDWFRADYLWHEGETQAVNTFNLGATLHW
ncbi:MAG TPA: porin [Polyangiaceae bacterium]|nr:porin [Polyangiaceae bacterium]